jgi:hypothetical protein
LRPSAEAITRWLLKNNNQRKWIVVGHPNRKNHKEFYDLVVKRLKELAKR